MTGEQRKHRILGLGLVAVYVILWTSVGWFSRTPGTPVRSGGFTSFPLPDRDYGCVIMSERTDQVEPSHRRNLFAFEGQTGNKDRNVYDDFDQLPEPTPSDSIDTSSSQPIYLEDPGPTIPLRIRFLGKVTLGNRVRYLLEVDGIVHALTEGKIPFQVDWQIIPTEKQQLCLAKGKPKARLSREPPGEVAENSSIKCFNPGDRLDLPPP